MGMGRGKEKAGEWYFFEHGFDVRVFLQRGAGFRAGRGEVREDFVVGEDGGLGFEDLHCLEGFWWGRV